MTSVYLSLGSNLGDKINNLNNGIKLLNEHVDIEVVKKSSLYETEPQGYKDQDHFVNMVVKCYTSLEPYALLKYTQSIERKLKRVKLFRWGPRTIDIDILTYGNEKIESRELIIPHPRMLERSFVLTPLSEINSEYKELAQKITDQFIKLID